MEYGKSVRRKTGEAMHRIIIDGNAFYEMDEACMRRKQEQEIIKQRQIEEKEKEQKKKMTEECRK